MILLGIGSNLAGPAGSPRASCEAALDALAKANVRLVRRSSWYETAPVPASDQPWFVNGVAAVEWLGDADHLLAVLHEVEADFGRARKVPNEARTLDLDLLDFRGEVAGGKAVLPHPRLHQRAFVLYPLKDVAPDWVHPVLRRTVDDLIADLPSGQQIRPMGA